MKKCILIFIILIISISCKSQWYYGAQSGVFFGTTTANNPDLNKEETWNYAGFFFNVPIGYHFTGEFHPFWKDWLFESDISYPLYVGTGVGRQFGDDEGNIQLLIGGGDYLVPVKHFQFEHQFSYNAKARININHFFIQAAYSNQTKFVGVGFKAYIFE